MTCDTQKREARNRLIGAVHAAAKHAGLDEETRRALMARVTGKRSCAEMTGAELGKVLDEINRNKPAADRPVVRKVRALWLSLYWLDVVNSREESALNAFVERQTGVAAAKWLKADQAASVIEALKAMATREAGVDWGSWAHHETLGHDAVPVIEALWDKLCDLGEMRVRGLHGWQRYVVACRISPAGATKPAHFNELIKRLGRRYRKAIGKLPVKQEALTYTPGVCPPLCKRPVPSKDGTELCPVERDYGFCPRRMKNGGRPPFKEETDG